MLFTIAVLSFYNQHSVVVEQQFAAEDISLRLSPTIMIDDGAYSAVRISL